MEFYLGTHICNWLWKKSDDIKFCVSRRTLEKRKSLFPANSEWILDSGGFSELSLNGKWELSSKEYVEMTRRFSNEIGKLDWAAIQDWMCEDEILKKTGKTIKQHQDLTVDSYIELKSLDPDLPWVPVIQGISLKEYMDCIDLYYSRGVELHKISTVGIGSVCRRQGTDEIAKIITNVYGAGINIHGFGIKTRALSKLDMVSMLKSSDSLAWSFSARRSEPLPGCTHLKCANCYKYATKWYNKVISLIEVMKCPKQLSLLAGELTPRRV